MPARPKYIQDLISQVELHTDRLANLRLETADLAKKSDVLKDAVADIRKDIALIDQRLKDQITHVEKLDGRLWYMIGGVFLALLALVANLIIASVK